VPEVREVRAGASTLGLDVATSEILRAEDIAPAFEALKGRADMFSPIRSWRDPKPDDAQRKESPERMPGLQVRESSAD
jgi:hypothetical protein